jgi:hypothetical protein
METSMLVIEIALGIVLAWLIINNFDELFELSYKLFEFAFKFIAYPFKIVWWIAREVYEFTWWITKEAYKFLAHFLRWAVPYIIGLMIIGTALILIMVVFQFVPDNGKGTAILFIFSIAIAAFAYVYLKDVYKILTDRFKSE